MHAQNGLLTSAVLEETGGIGVDVILAENGWFYSYFLFLCLNYDAKKVMSLVLKTTFYSISC